MAYRIHNSITSGEFDFRVKGKITGHLDVLGSDVPVQVDLEGYPTSDLVGLLIRFQNPDADSPLPRPLHPVQQGRAGELTASRKHPILDCPIEEAWDLGMHGLPVPEHMANILYLEWFSDHNGRVVLEVPEAKIEIEGLPVWRMTPEEIRRQQPDMSEQLEDFMRLLEESFEVDPPTDEEEGI